MKGFLKGAMKKVSSNPGEVLDGLAGGGAVRRQSLSVLWSIVGFSEGRFTMLYKYYKAWGIRETLY